MTLAKVPAGIRSLLAAVIVVAAIVTFSPVSRASGYFRDFNAFYCAGAVIASGHDPYLAEPIGSCERGARPDWVQGGGKNVSLPAPLPPYALAPFVLLSRLPFVTAAWLWSALLVLALGITVWSLRRTTKLALSVLCAIFAIDGYSAIFLGEIAVVAVAAIALAVMLLERGKPAQAAIVAALALVEPHIGLPAALALFLCVPAARLPLASAGAFFAVFSGLLVGTGTVLEYVGAVLPSHALSEIHSERQLSLTSVVHSLGGSDSLALAAGYICYYAMLLAGLAVAFRLVRRSPRDGLIIAAPVALALVGGVFNHVAQMQAALPAALLGFQRTTGRARTLFGVAIVLLAIPWIQFTFLGLIFVPVAAMSVAFLMRALLGRSLVESGLAALAAVAFIGALIFGIAADSGAPLASLPRIVPGDLAEINWALHVAVQGERNKALFLIARVPSWGGIGLLALAIFGLARRSGTALSGVRERPWQHLVSALERKLGDAFHGGRT